MSRLLRSFPVFWTSLMVGLAVGYLVGHAAYAQNYLMCWVGYRQLVEVWSMLSPESG